MAKIIQITGEVVTIGMEDGTLTEVRPSDLNFIPALGDWKNQNRYFICTFLLDFHSWLYCIN